MANKKTTKRSTGRASKKTSKNTTTKKKIKKSNKKSTSKKTTKKKTSRKKTTKNTNKKQPIIKNEKDEKIQKVLDQALEKVKPDEKEISEFQSILDKFIKKVRKRISNSDIDAEVFVGGSFAKSTVVKKEKYDADVFIRFSKKHKNKNLSKLTKKFLKGIKKQKIHGSRDYFKIYPKKKFAIEVVPVLKINKPEEAENVTDLSYSHVKYVKDKASLSKKLLDEIKLAKAFCEANKCYGAESYINGFSGYALELLIIYYRSFLNFLKNTCILEDIKDSKPVIDIENKYDNKNQIMLDLNSSKLNSPIILIDPTYKKRNSLAALSEETFEKFKEKCKDFLKNPDLKYFEKQKTDINQVKKQAKQRGERFLLLEAKTTKQPGDIAGSKLSKFHKHLAEEISQFFEIHEKGFNYDMKKTARFFFVLKPKKEIVFMGPPVKDKENVKRFRKEHKKVIQKGERLYALEKVNNTPREFVKEWKKNNKRKLKEMSIKKLRILE